MSIADRIAVINSDGAHAIKTMSDDEIKDRAEQIRDLIRARAGLDTAKAEPAEPAKPAKPAKAAKAKAEPKPDKPFESTAKATTKQEALEILLANGGLSETEIRAIVKDEIGQPAPAPVYHPKDQAPIELDGQHYAMADILFWLEAGEDVYMHGPAGTGKTTILEHVNAALTPDHPARFAASVLDKVELLGFIDANGNYRPTAFREWYEHGGTFLLDEMDACEPEALAALNAALENGRCPFPDRIVERHPDALLLGGGNTLGTGATGGYSARQPIDRATRDRFVNVHVDYDPNIERAIAKSFSPSHYEQALQAVYTLREKCAELEVEHTLSMRAIRRVAIAMEAGREVSHILYAGLDADQRALLS